MALRGPLGSFHHPGVSRIDYKPLDMDRILTALLARLWHHGMPSKISRTSTLDVEVFVKLFLEHPEVFEGFDRETTTRWTVTHLMDMVNRGRADEAVAAPRPLHGFTYRFRNSRKSRPYGADEQLYEMLSVDDGALKGLREFFFSDVDRATGAITPGPDTDVETQALLHLVELAGGKVRDQADTGRPRTPYPPLCAEPAQLLCQDVMRLLYHQDRMPRTVLVDYLKTLFAFHLALYHLRMMKLLPAVVEAGTVPAGCRKGHGSQAAADRCPYQVRLFLDAGGTPGTPAAALAEHSADIWYRRIPRFIQATYQVKKLDDFAESLARAGALSRPEGRTYFTPEEALRLLDRKRRKDRDAFFLQRITRVRDEEKDLPAELKQLIQLGLDPFDEYTEMLMHYRGRHHRVQFVKCLDSMLLKHRPGALLAQPRGGRADAARRFVLDGRLLEVLLQVSLLREKADGTGGLATTPMRVDEFLALLRGRYGLHIDRLPEGDGFAGAHLDDQAALRANSAAFLNRLREIGYYQDMSDAYLTQTITPRYAIGTAARTGVSTR
ncbi:methylation-associated defense system protein MAD7 [Streptomyces xiamenensis]|uniref:methylation-associated defense system protein MAD7 n=1 Tax=Streptomyces xiamenensis TaxID=408015 RepID=UPI0037D09C05